MMRTLASALLFAATSMIAACTDDPVENAEFAIDADESGAVDCADLDHVLTCLHHPESELCAVADINGDGIVDDGDVHDIHAGLQATGHHCGEPDHHDDDAHHGTDHTGDPNHEDPVGEHDDGHHTDGHHDEPTDPLHP